VAKKPNPYHDYPKADDMRTGNKVGWRIYSKREDAEACAEAAKHNARIQASLGYDFGYQSPGSITELPDGRYEVVIP
jgi:hypothetical protein